MLPLLECRRSFSVSPDPGATEGNLAAAEAREPDPHMRIYLNLMKALIDPRHVSFRAGAGGGAGQLMR